MSLLKQYYVVQWMGADLSVQYLYPHERWGNDIHAAMRFESKKDAAGHAIKHRGKGQMFVGAYATSVVPKAKADPEVTKVYS